jgi:3-hydroxybutyrate dehydrogenase
MANDVFKEAPKALNARVALITGSLGGIGFEIGLALARKGCAVVLNGIGDTSSSEAQLAKLREAGGDGFFHGADISDPSQIEDLVAAVLARYGRIDILVNNAVTRFDANIDVLPVDKWAQALAVNLTAPFHLSRLTLPGMKERQWGRIINLSSIYGVTGTAGRGDYVVTKHGLVGMTKVIALECAGLGVTCNALCPGAVETPHIKQLMVTRALAAGMSVEDFTRKFLEPRQPSKTFVQPDKVGALAAFLCTDEACDITGATLPIDGGWQARG